MSSKVHVPFIAAATPMPEFTARAVIVGALLGIVFGASSLYLVLKVGLTVSASIPVAVISITFFRLLSRFRVTMVIAATLVLGALDYLISRALLGDGLWPWLPTLLFAGVHAAIFWRWGASDASVLEHNIVQTAGSAGESIAFGVGVTMPAILILGFDLEVVRVTLVAVLGGLLGILMMIPLRRALIVDQHGTLKYPEGTACAEVLKAGASADSRAAADPSFATANNPAAEAQRAAAGRTIFLGFAVGLIYKIANVAAKLWKDTPGVVFGKPLLAGSVAAEISPELLGVGYIIGPQIAAVMCAGGVLAYLVLIPMIKFFGDGLPLPLSPGTLPISQMDPHKIRSAYVLYIGAGAVAAGGIISLVRSLPLIWHGLRQGLADLRRTTRAAASVLRTDLDLPIQWVGIGILVLLAAIVAAPPLHMNLLGAVLIVVFGFLFVTVSSRLTGEIGSSSNPISGMTVATLLLTCLTFLLVGWTGGTHYVTALSVGAIVCIAASNGGTTSQDLKTGFLVGATPRLQQLAILAGALGSAVFLGPLLLRLNDAATVYVPVHSAVVAPAAALGPPESLSEPQAKADRGRFRPWQVTAPTGELTPGRYLVDAAGHPKYLVDPGINGTHDERPDGSKVRKFEAPKATLMSYIIKGILDRQLPWALVLFGVMIAVVLELSGIPSLAFAVGVYLPLSSSTPIFVGGCVRWLVDRRQRRQRAVAVSAEEEAAASDRSPGVLLSSGYIAGGAIAGIVIAFLAGVLDNLDAELAAWAERANPFYAGPSSDALSLLPFAAITALLYWAGRTRQTPTPDTPH